MSDETTNDQEQTQEAFEKVLRRMLTTPPAPRTKKPQNGDEDTPEGSGKLDSKGS